MSDNPYGAEWLNQVRGRGDYAPAHLAYIEELAKGPHTMAKMALMFNTKFNTNWTRSKIGSLCYRMGWRVREAHVKVEKVAKEKPIKYVKVPLDQPGFKVTKSKTWSPPGTISSRIEFKGPAQQLPKPLPNTSFRPDMRPQLKKPLKLPGGVSPVPYMGLKPTPPKVMVTQPQPSREKNIVDLAYTGECKFPTTPFATAPSDHLFCGAPAEAGKVYCEVHEKFCHIETKNLRRKA